MCLTPVVGVVDDSTQLIPVCSAGHGAVGTEDEVGSSILQHLVHSSLGFFYGTVGDNTETLQSAKDRTAKTLLASLRLRVVPSEKFRGTLIMLVG